MLVGFRDGHGRKTMLYKIGIKPSHITSATSIPLSLVADGKILDMGFNRAMDPVGSAHVHDGKRDSLKNRNLKSSENSS
jgi:hypothetical protein